MTSLAAGVSPAWLALREPADAAARAVELVDVLRDHLPTGRPAVVHDLGCGSGSMSRWLGPRLPGPQHWVAYDRDPHLLTLAAGTGPPTAADGSAITVEPRCRDITRLRSTDLAGASLITASALLDVLTADEIDRIAAVCSGVGCPALFTLSVVGRVELTPAEPLDGVLAAAFNAHQRRTSAGRRLLGPDAVGVAAAAFVRRGCDIVLRASPWRLGAEHSALASAWLAGWIGAACERRPELSAAAREYAQRRSASAAAGRLRVTLHHQDMLARPHRPGRATASR